MEPILEQSLATARTSLVALADGAGSEARSAYEHVLIALDRIHDDLTPDVYLEGVVEDHAQQFAAASAAIEALKEYGVDPLSVALLLWMLEDAHAEDHR